MTDASVHSETSIPRCGWSNRILIVAIAGILFITLYPFRFHFDRHIPRVLYPFSLDGWGKKSDPRDAFLNILLFVPYGFGFATKFREQGKSRIGTLGLTFAAGALLSYIVEFLQIYNPWRDSGWEDVFTNSFGAAAGAILCNIWGGAVLPWLSAAGRRVGAWLTWQRALLVLLLYLGLWSAAAVWLQRESRLSDWNSDTLLVIGNAASNHSIWKGQIFELEFWDYAVPSESARRLSLAGLRPDRSGANSIVFYRFSGSAPFRDERHQLGDLFWTSEATTSTTPNGVFLDGKSSLISDGTVSALVSDLKRTGQFSLRLVCKPADVDQDAQIVSLSSLSGFTNLELRQEGADLVFWFRTPLSLRRDRMSWGVPGTFTTSQVENMLLSFDGAKLSLFTNGIEASGSYERYELGVGAALARFVRRIKTGELVGYRYIFYTMVFLPAGCLVGFAWRTATEHWIGRFCLTLGLLLPAVLLEVILALVCGRTVSLEDIWLSILLTASGSLWINADRDWLARR
jgi:hypothetical protein